MTALPSMTTETSPTGSRVRLLRRPGSRPGLDLLLEDINPGHAVFSTHVSTRRVITGSVGSERVCATLLDLSLAAAVQSTLEPGDTYRVLAFRVRQLQGGLPLLKRVHCEGDTTARGRRIITASGRVVDAAGRVRAYGWLVVRVPANSTHTHELSHPHRKPR